MQKIYERLQTIKICWPASFWFVVGFLSSAMGQTYHGIDVMEGSSLQIPKALPGKVDFYINGFAPFSIDMVQQSRDVFIGENITSRYQKLRIKMQPAPLGWRVFLEAFARDKDGVFRSVKAIDTALGFVRSDIPKPERPQYIHPAPTPPEQHLGTLAFLQSYPFWPSSSVKYALSILDPQQLHILTLFPLIVSDITQRVCPSTFQDIGVKKFLTRVNEACDSLQPIINQVVETAPSLWYKKLQLETAFAQRVISCANALSPQSSCQDIMPQFAEFAASILPLKRVLNNLNSYKVPR
ncbi:MAG: hypothetical protein ACON5C_07685 [Alphaproteobacteria bacterium]